MASKAGVGYGNNDPEHAHAVTHLDGVQKYWYDLNGNMTIRIVDGNTYNLAGACPERREGTPRAAWSVRAGL